MTRGAAPATLENITRAFEDKILNSEYDVNFGLLDEVSMDFDWWGLDTEQEDKLVNDLYDWFVHNEKRLAREQAKAMRDRYEERRLERKYPDNY